MIWYNQVIIPTPPTYSLPYKPNEHERTGRIMKIWKKIKGKLPVVVTLCCCLAVAGLSALVKGDGKAVEVSTGASQKQVVIIDAGHGGYVLN